MLQVIRRPLTRLTLAASLVFAGAAPGRTDLLGLGEPEVLARGGTSAVQAAPRTLVIPEREANVLAALALLEAGAGCPEDPLDVTQAVLNRLRLGSWGRTLSAVAFAPGQFASLFHHSPREVSTEAGVIAALRRDRGLSLEAARAALRRFRQAIADPVRMAASRRFVGGRTDFKGVSQYPNRYPAEDPLRRPGCNFFHIAPGQSPSTLRRLEGEGPDRLLVP